MSDTAQVELRSGRVKAPDAWLADEDAVPDNQTAAIRDACLSVQHRLEGSRPNKRPRASLVALPVESSGAFRGGGGRGVHSLTSVLKLRTFGTHRSR